MLELKMFTIKGSNKMVGNRIYNNLITYYLILCFITNLPNSITEFDGDSIIYHTQICFLYHLHLPYEGS